MATLDKERQRLEDLRHKRPGADWRRWGPYVSARAWGTVREDYSPEGSAWDFLPHDHARSKAYRWNEDGLAAICDSSQELCFGLALWNGRDPILKERPFGLSGPEGNHGEDVKEYYFFLDNLPSHAYMKMLYKYPQAAFPYEDLVKTNAARTRHDPEYELLDTGVFADSKYWDITVEYAKAAPDDILIQITAANRGPDTATLDILPTLWYRNVWAWGWHSPKNARPQMKAVPLAPYPAPPSASPPLPGGKGAGGLGALGAGGLGSPLPPAGEGPGVGASGPVGAAIHAEHHELGPHTLLCSGAPDLLFTDNETNAKRLYGVDNPTPYVKDGLNEYIVGGIQGAVNPAQTGTKACARYQVTVDGGQETTIRLRLTNQPVLAPPSPFLPPLPGGKGAGGVGSGESSPLGDGFTQVLAARIAEADAFYDSIGSPELSSDARRVMRQAFAGLLWSKQFYKYDVVHWLGGDPGQPAPPPARLTGRNHEWKHLNAKDIISMPDTWEYPWFAAWDLAFHCLPLAVIDPQFAKEQLLLLGHEWYQHPNGQMPAYEWAFGDVNPPVQAWAALRVYQIEARVLGQEGDFLFLEKMFHKLLMNFTWWVNRKDAEGNNVFQGGFLGLDNIGLFDRSQPLPTGGYLEQSDGTSWMAMFCLNMLSIALELTRRDPSYEDMATKFFEHFVYIAHAMNTMGTADVDLFDDEDGFYYDVLHHPDGTNEFLRVRSMVGLIPLLAVDTIEEAEYVSLEDFQQRIAWFLANRPELVKDVADLCETGHHGRRLLSIVSPDRLRIILTRMLDETEFLSPHGLRGVSRFHLDHPCLKDVDGVQYRVDYEPAESTTGLFGGNSNWRGPVWFPLNYLLIEALQKYDYYLGPEFTVPFPTGSGQSLTLSQVAVELSRRLTRTFLRGDDGRRPVYGGTEVFQTDPHWNDLLLYFEYFHGDNGAGIGASHQTGWTGLVAKLIEQSGE